MRLTACYVLLSFCLFFSACTSFSKNPLSEQGYYGNDPRLVGVWFQSGDSPNFIHIGQGGEGLMDVVVVEHNKKGTLDSGPLKIFTTSLKNRNFINYRSPVNKKREAEGSQGARQEDDVYLILLYEITELGDLTFRFMSDKYLAANIEKGRLKGTVSRDGWLKVTITDSTSNLNQFIDEADIDQLFGKPSKPYRKLVLPLPSSSK